MREQAGKDALATLRAERQALLREIALTAYWRRLVRARLDLVVAVAACPDLPALVAERAELANLPGLCSATSPEGAVSLERLDIAGRYLDSHREALQGRVDIATEELVEALRQDPSACLTPVCPARRSFV